MSAVSTSLRSQLGSMKIEEFQYSIAREQMDGFVRSGNIEKIKASLSQDKVFERMLSEHCFEPEALNRLLIAAIEDDCEAIRKMLLEYSGSVQIQEPEDLERRELVRLLLEYHAFDPATTHCALKKASKYGRLDLVSEILRKATVSKEMVQSALLEAIQSGWLETVDLLLKEPASERFDRDVWSQGVSLSHSLGFDAIACSLIEKMGSIELEKVKNDLLDPPSGDPLDTASILFFIDKCLHDIEYLRGLCLHAPAVKRRRLDFNLPL